MNRITMLVSFIVLNLIFFSPLLNGITKTVDMQNMRIKKCGKILKEYFKKEADRAAEYNTFYAHIASTSLPLPHTLFGKIMLEEITLTKKIDKKYAEERESLVKELIDNQRLRISLENLLKEIADTQDLFLAYMDEDTLEHEKLASAYFGSWLADQGLNNSPLALTLKWQLDRSAFIACTGLIAYAPLFFCAALNYRIAQIRTEEALRDTSTRWTSLIKESLMLPLRSLDPRKNIYKDGYFTEKVTHISDLTQGDRAVIWSQNNELPLSVGYIFCYAQAAGCINSVYNACKKSYDYTAYKASQLNTLSQELTVIQKLKEKVDVFMGKKPKNLISHTDPGSLLHMHNELKNSKSELLDFCKLCGELDLCYALAQTIMNKGV